SANSTMYDGGTALAEAVKLSAAQTKKKKILGAKAIHPESRAVIETDAKAPNLEIVEIEHQNGLTDLDQLKKEIDEDTASVVIQYPYFFGQIEPLDKVKDLM